MWIRLLNLAKWALIDYITKPFSAEQLQFTIEKILK